MNLFQLVLLLSLFAQRTSFFAHQRRQTRLVRHEFLAHGERWSVLESHSCDHDARHLMRVSLPYIVVAVSRQLAQNRTRQAHRVQAQKNFTQRFTSTQRALGERKNAVHATLHYCCSITELSIQKTPEMSRRDRYSPTH